MFLGDQIQNWVIIVLEHPKPKFQWRSSNKKLCDPHTLKSSETTENEDAHSCSRRPREKNVAVRVRAELTQDGTDHQELVMFRSASNISDLYQLNDSTYQCTNIRS